MSKEHGLPCPLAIVMITLNEEHNMRAVMENIADFAAEVFVVDSYSSDKTVDIALEAGAQVVQRRFTGFGDQWNYAATQLPIKSAWTMKLDPDEQLSVELKSSIRRALQDNHADGFRVVRRLWFMGKQLSATQNILRIWKTGTCHFPKVLVNEHPIIDGVTQTLDGILEHHDSPDLHHWIEKQNRYTTAEAVSAFTAASLSEKPSIFGNRLQRRMWMKNIYPFIPARHVLMFLYCYIVMGAWKAGKVGIIWSRMRAELFRNIQDKVYEMKLRRTVIVLPAAKLGKPDKRVKQILDKQT